MKRGESEIKKRDVENLNIDDIFRTLMKHGRLNISDKKSVTNISKVSSNQ